MKKLIWGGILLTGLFLIASQFAISDSDEDEFFEEGSYSNTLSSANPFYREECGSCHFAYPPALLPARSWEKLMDNLSDHFGENAELLPEDHKALREYLVNHAGDKNRNQWSRKSIRSLNGKGTPIRVSEIPYIQRKHHEIPSRLIKENPEVKNLGNCPACHKRAEQGSFEEDEVNIPGYGRWDD